MADSEFNGKVAVVTGAASGIGRSILVAFLQRGAKGVLADVDDEWGRNIEDEMRRAGHDILFVKTDVTSGGDVAHLFEKAVGAYRQVDIVVNAAGIRVRNEVVDLSEQEWD